MWPTGDSDKLKFVGHRRRLFVFFAASFQATCRLLRSKDQEFILARDLF
jgi:hypothetical protein